MASVYTQTRVKAELLAASLRARGYITHIIELTDGGYELFAWRQR